MSTNINEWIGVDLDGTLALYTEWKGIEHIGDPIEPMVNRVKEWLEQGTMVRIVTARVSCDEPTRSAVVAYIEAWCLKHIGQVLPVTASKDFGMIELWDDRCVEVVPNTGQTMISFIHGGGYQ